ncbi:METTL5 family protein [Saliphagus sp. LR7]|uniref:METTL5 family protein n=1 Tax=Saliphagus sp. LR7 TaxID=2282654 RepID=UPI001E64EEB2|nr:METTL5 family protein [Saliphagus sp. LR7]
MASRQAIERRLESVADFADPSIELEQYLTPPELAANLLQVAALRGDLTGETVVDLGTGTGTLAVGAALFSPERVVGIDVDPGALALARENERRVAGEPVEGGREPTPIDWLRGDVRRHPLRAPRRTTVLANPPFGAQRGARHADRPFLEAASELAAVSLSIHNEGSREFVERLAGERGGTVTEAFRAAFPVDNRFPFHDEERRELAVEVFRIEW